MAKVFKRQLRALRERLGYTQAFVAKLLGVSAPRVSEWERGVRSPKPLTQEAIILKLKGRTTSGKKGRSRNKVSQ